MTRKLDLGCGASKAEGFEGADIAPCPGVDHVFDLMQFPWPFPDETFDELRSSHQVEHIPQAYFTPNPKYPIAPNMTAVAEGPHSLSLWFKFFSEAWRILKPGGTFHVIAPFAKSGRAFQDPTHTRFIVEASFDYLDRDWRKANKLEHAAYAASMCHFPASERHTAGGATPAQNHELSLMSEWGRSAAVQKYWDVLSDVDVTLVKPGKPAKLADAVAGQEKQETATAIANAAP